MSSTFEMKYDGLDILIEVKDHAMARIRQRGMVKSAVIASVVAALNFILDFKIGQELAVVDEDSACTVVAAVRSTTSEIVIEVITVIDNTDVFVKKGTAIVRIGEKLRRG